MGIKDKNKIYTAEELAPGKQIIFAATGVTEGALMKRRALLRRRRAHLVAHHDQATGKVRFIESIHLEKKPDVKVSFS